VGPRRVLQEGGVVVVRYRVRYCCGYLSGYVEVDVDENADAQDVILAAERELARRGPPVPPNYGRAYKLERVES
jgi:hypothetical protein